MAKSMAAWLVPTVSSVAAEVTRSAIEMALAEVASKREAVLAKAAEEIAARHRAVKATAKRERMSKQKAAQQQAQQHAIAVPRMSRTFGGAPAGKRKRTAEPRTPLPKKIKSGGVLTAAMIQVRIASPKNRR